MRIKKGVEEIDHRILVPVPELEWIVNMIFQLAADRGWGGGRIAKYLNNHPDISDELKPFLDSTISDMLDNTIYFGQLTWGKNCTDVVDDVRILQPLPEDEWVRNPNFCRGIVSRDLWNRSQKLRKERRRRKAERDANSSSNEVIPRAKGVALRYPLSGLVVCAACGRAMKTSSGGKYTTVDGKERNYVSYVCPGKYSDACENDQQVPEGWLRQSVFQLVRERLCLIPEITSEQLMRSPHFQELLEAVQSHYEQRQPDTLSLQRALESERESLEDQRRGLGHSLSNPQLDCNVRRMLEENLGDICSRLQEIDHKLIEMESADFQKETALNPEVVAERLSRLSELLDGDHASATNVILSQHIAVIECDPSGRVVVRSCLLGALANPDQIASSLRHPTEETEAIGPGIGRRRTRRSIEAIFEDDEQTNAANDFAVDPNRYAGLSPEWFTEDVFQVPDNRPWYQTNATVVAEYRLENHSTIEELQIHFKKCKPTIYKSLNYAKDEHGIDAFGLEVSVSKRKNWSRDNAQRVIDFFSQPGATMKAAEEFFGKSQPTISKAKKFAEEFDLQPREAKEQEYHSDDSGSPDAAA